MIVHFLPQMDDGADRELFHREKKNSKRETAGEPGINTDFLLNYRDESNNYCVMMKNL